MKQKALVTGGAGFIGSWLCLELEKRGYEVWILDDLSSGSEKNLHFLKNSHLIRGSILNENDLDQIPFEHMNEVFHLAAKGDVHESLKKPLEYMKVNCEGTHRVLERCRFAKIPFLLMSTCMVYGLTPQRKIPEEGIDENFPVLPVSPYGASKLAAEQIVLSYRYSYGCPVKIARPFNTYGPHQKADNLEGGVIPLFLHETHSNHELKVFGDGTQTRDFLYVEDCVRFLCDYLKSPTTCEILNAGTGHSISILELARKINPSHFSLHPHPHPQSEIPTLLCNNKKAMDLIGFQPKFSLDQGIDKTARWLKGNL